MKYIKIILLNSGLLLLSVLLVSCVTESSNKEADSQMAENQVQPIAEPIVQPATPAIPTALPVRYQTASYVVDSAAIEDIALEEETTIKVGARITSTRGPQPLWDIIKRLAALKGMNVSWASDVDRNVLVDVDIGANDDFYEAIDSMLRQVDYYHEMQGTTIVVKYKETRQFHVAMPFTKHVYDTQTGGNVLGNQDTNSNVAGTIRLDSTGNEFDIWQNIVDNMDAILATWSTTADTPALAPSDPAEDTDGTETAGSDTAIVSRQVSSSGNTYTIDKPVGLITVHAPRPLLDKLDIYFKNLKNELFKQITIEAKILEVYLNDYSSIGLDWNLLLRSLSVAGGYASYSNTYSKNRTDQSSNSIDRTNSNNSSSSSTSGRDRTFDYLADDNLTGDTASNVFSNIVDSAATSLATSGASTATIITDGLTKGVSGAISLAAFSFDSFLNAVNEQGQTTVLSNPKLSVLNGQPAMIIAGRNVTYIDSIESDVNNETGTISYTVETERILSGVGLSLTATILDDEQIILNLVPVTSELEEPIEYRQVGLGQVGLPIVNVREMSTTVRVKNEEMLVIGGLISSIDESDGTFVPGTSNIPFFKYLFGYEQKLARKRELIILLKPRII